MKGDNIKSKDLSRKGLLYIVSAPSGVGKSTVIKHVINNSENLKFSISVTTRPRRKEEVEGRDYFFKTREEFYNLIEEGAFLEYAEVYGNFYGTLNNEVIGHLRNGTDVIMDIDYQGANLIKNVLPYDTILIYILPPSLHELERRLRSRNQDAEDIIKYRIAKSKNEMHYIDRYDYIVINDDLNKAVGDIECIIQCNRKRINRIQNLQEIIKGY